MVIDLYFFLSFSFIRRGLISVTMYNFGSPRVGNKVFAEIYNEVSIGIEISQLFPACAFNSSLKYLGKCPQLSFSTAPFSFLLQSSLVATWNNSSSIPSIKCSCQSWQSQAENNFKIQDCYKGIYSLAANFPTHSLSF